MKLTFILLLFPVYLYSQDLTGKVVGVIDGDKIEFQTKDSTFKASLKGVDAPELDQPFGWESKKLLDSYLNKPATVKLHKLKQEDNISVTLFVEGENVNLSLISLGYAWHFKEYSTDGQLALAEIFTREQKLGLWQYENPTSPSDFRKGILNRPNEPTSTNQVLICTNPSDKLYHKRYCPVCGEGTTISKVVCSYAFKLLLQEMMSLGLAPRLKLKEKI